MEKFLSRYKLSQLIQEEIDNLNIPMGFSGSSAGKESACNAVDPGSIPDQEDPLEKIQAIHFSILGLPWWLAQLVKNLPAMQETWV